MTKIKKKNVRSFLLRQHNQKVRMLIMMTVEQIKKRLGDANLKRVAENAGVHPATVYRFMQEESKPLYETVKALSDYLTRQEATING